MSGYYNENGYLLTIQKGVNAVRGLRSGFSIGTGSREENITRLKDELASAEAVVIGAGAGLSTAAGLTYSGERFEKYFFDFKERFGINDMYSGGFYPFPDDESRWAWWARHIYFNRYIDPPKSVYNDLLGLVKARTISSSPPTSIISFSARALIKSVCSIRRGITACSRRWAAGTERHTTTAIGS